MKKVIELINSLKNSPIKETIDKKMKEFEGIPRTFEGLFRELVFCLLTAGTSAELGLKTISHLGDSIYTDSQEEIQRKLKEVYRFHTLRAKYIFEARENFKHININSENLREEIVKNIKGIGMKESSHFMRNIGLNNVAIIDFHIVDFLAKNELIGKPSSKSLTKKKYIEIENILRQLAKKSNLSLGELDLYLWYSETGKVLK